MNRKLSKAKKLFILCFLFFTFVAILVYLCVRIILILMSNFSLIEGILTFSLLWAESFILIHSLRYFLNIYRVINQESSFTTTIDEPKLNTYPPCRDLRGFI